MLHGGEETVVACSEAIVLLRYLLVVGTLRCVDARQLTKGVCIAGRGAGGGTAGSRESGCGILLIAAAVMQGVAA